MNASDSERATAATAASSGAATTATTTPSILADETGRPPEPHRPRVEAAGRREPIDAVISALAAEQHGAVHRDQLTAAGLDRHAIARRRRRHFLHAVSADVFAVGHPRLSRRGRAIAALLQAGDGSCLSHISAARLWGLVDPNNDGEIHVSTTTRRGVALPDRVVLHRPRTLTDGDIVVHRGLRVTSPERTLRDLLPEHSVPELTRLLERAVTVVGRSPDELHAWAANLTRVRGSAKLDRALDDIVGPVVLRSQLEAEFRSLCQSAGLPLAETNVRLGRWEVDVLWRELRLIVELDSWRFHSGRWAFHRDRRKALALAAEGYEVLRLTWSQVKHDRAAVADALARVIDRRSA